MGRITSKGQVTVPLAIRKRLGIRPGDRVSFRVTGDVVVLEAENADLRHLSGSVVSGVRGVSLSDMELAIQSRRAGSIKATGRKKPPAR